MHVFFVEIYVFGDVTTSHIHFVHFIIFISDWFFWWFRTRLGNSFSIAKLDKSINGIYFWSTMSCLVVLFSGLVILTLSDSLVLYEFLLFPIVLFLLWALVLSLLFDVFSAIFESF